MFQGCGAVIALLLTCATLVCDVESAPSPPPPPAPYIPSGRDKDAWPELLNMEVDAAINILNSSGLVQNIYVQPPSSGPAPANLGKTTDVWIYTDGSVVYETPRRGVWHANRLIPGWPEVSGMSYKSAIAKIKADYLGVTVVYGPKSAVFRTADLRMDRVYVDINPDSTVAGIPSVG